MAKAAKATKARRPLPPVVVVPPDPVAARAKYDAASRECLRLNREAPRSNAWRAACDHCDRTWRDLQAALAAARKHV